MNGPSYTRAERQADAWVHAGGLGLALLGGPVIVALAARQGDGATVAAVAVYVATLLATMALSACYNLITAPAWRGVLRRLDHGAIYLKIAGTYTPFAVVSLGGPVGAGLLTAVWGIAGVGCALKLAAPGRFERAQLALYLVLGWAGLWVAGDVVAAISPAGLTLLAAGGLIYSGGVAFLLWERLPFHNAIWHAHVLVASALMFAAVVVEVV